MLSPFAAVSCLFSPCFRYSPLTFRCLVVSSFRQILRSDAATVDIAFGAHGAEVAFRCPDDLERLLTDCVYAHFDLSAPRTVHAAADGLRTPSPARSAASQATQLSDVPDDVCVHF